MTTEEKAAIVRDAAKAMRDDVCSTAQEIAVMAELLTLADASLAIVFDAVEAARND